MPTITLEGELTSPFQRSLVLSRSLPPLLGLGRGLRPATKGSYPLGTPDDRPDRQLGGGTDFPLPTLAYFRLTTRLVAEAEVIEERRLLGRRRVSRRSGLMLS